MNGRPGVADYALLLLLSTVWGSSFLFIKLGIDGLGPMTLTAARLVIAAACMVLVARMSGGQASALKGFWPVIVAAGFFGNALPFFLISWGEQTIDSALAAILMALMPLTTVLLAHLFTSDEKLDRYKAAGVVLGIIGLVVLIGPGALATLGDDTIRQLAVAGAAVSYGINALLTKRLAGLPPRLLTAGIISASCLIMVPASLVFEAPLTMSPSNMAIFATVTLGLAHTAFATILMVTIIRRQGASFFSQLNFLVPLVGVALGALFLGEQIGVNALTALGLILTGIAVTRYGSQRAARQAR